MKLFGVNLSIKVIVMKFSTCLASCLHQKIALLLTIAKTRLQLVDVSHVTSSVHNTSWYNLSTVPYILCWATQLLERLDFVDTLSHSKQTNSMKPLDGGNTLVRKVLINPYLHKPIYQREPHTCKQTTITWGQFKLKGCTKWNCILRENFSSSDIGHQIVQQKPVIMRNPLTQK